MFRFFSLLTRRPAGTKTVRTKPGYRPRFEELESRWVPADLTVPAYSSLPGAAASVYLDFDGNYESSWGSYGAITSPAYSTDSDLTTFSSSELSNIYDVWRFVAEDYAPFNINVTTVQPSSFADKVAVRVVIGGSSSWTGGTYGGIAYVGGFANGSSNTVYVFPNHLGNGYPKYVADAASHESGHSFGVSHQSSYSGTTKTADYQSGPGDGTAPLMGNSYSASRSLWWYGASNSSTTFQDDMAVIASNTNGFGYRPDDHGNQSNATSLAVSSTGAIDAGGIVEKMTDSDWFSFVTGAGTITLTADVAEPFANLDAKLELYDSSGTLIATASPTSSFDATITVTVSAGSYYVVVSSAGVSANATSTNYGFNVGKYRLTGTVIATTTSGDAPAAPSSLSAAALSVSAVRLSWTDNASNEDGFRIERLVNGVWTQVAVVSANTTSWDDTGLSSGTSYSYRVRAYNAYGSSAFTSIASATTNSAPGNVPNAASNLTASQKTKPRLRNVLIWRDNSANETGFYIDRSTDGGATWVRLGQVGANVTTYTDRSIAKGIVYTYRVIAFNNLGLASSSNLAQAGSVTSGGTGKGANAGLAAGQTTTLTKEAKAALNAAKREAKKAARLAAREAARARRLLSKNLSFKFEVELNENVAS